MTRRVNRPVRRLRLTAAALLALAPVLAGCAGTIAGYVQDESGRGVPGVTLTFSNGAGSARTQPDGFYEHSVARGWSGMVTPELPGTTFEPADRWYQNVTRSYRGQHYTAKASSGSGGPPVGPGPGPGPAGTVTVAGSIRTEQGEAIAGAALTFDHGGPVLRTNSAGRFQGTVPTGWTGTVRPSLKGYEFEPPARAVGPVNRDFRVTFVGRRRQGATTDPIIKPPRPYESPITKEEKRALVDRLRIAILSVGAVSQETLTLAAGDRTTDICLRAARSALADRNFRVQNVGRDLTYESTAADVTKFARDNDLAFVVQLRGASKQFDKFGNYYLFEAGLDAKIVKADRGELIAERRFTRRGKRSRDEAQAAEDALSAAAREAVEYLTDEILRKRDRLHTTIVTLSEVGELRRVDNITRELRRRPGIAYVSLESWSEKTRTAKLEIVHSTYARDQLGAYLETLRSERIKVTVVTRGHAGPGAK